MDPSLRENLLYPNWLLIVGIGLLVASIAIPLSVYVGYRHSNIAATTKRLSLSQARKVRYLGLIDEVNADYRSGKLDGRGAHLALAAIIRAAASERLSQNVESVTVFEAASRYPQWPQLTRSLQWCEEPSFSTRNWDQEITIGSEMAREVVSQ